MLWRKGVLAWADWERTGGALVSPAKRKSVDAGLAKSRAALAARDAAFFLRTLPKAHAARAAAACPERVAFLDVETDGLGPTARPTTAVLFTRGATTAYVRGVNLDALPEALADVGLLVTYNGRRFDLPVLRREFGVLPAVPHLDLCPLLQAWGHFGGLKAIERRLGLTRPTGTSLDGEAAVALWQQYAAAGDAEALAALLRYNAQDAIGLAALLRRALRWSMAAYPLRLAWPPAPRSPGNLTLPLRPAGSLTNQYHCL